MWWRLTKYVTGLDNEDLGLRKASDVEQLAELLKKEFHTEEASVERNMYNELVYTVHFKFYPTVMIVAAPDKNLADR